MRILVVANGPSNTEAALTLGRQFFRRAEQPPTVLTVVKRGSPLQTNPVGQIRTNYAKQLQPSPEAQIKVRIGCPHDQIVHETSAEAYDLLIVGDTSRRRPTTHLLRTSLALHLVDHALCPVLVAKGKVDAIRRILLCDSGAEGPSLPSHFISRLATLLDAEEEVTVLHVMSQMSAGPGVLGRQLRASATDLLEQEAPEANILKRNLEVLQRPGLLPHPEVRHGLVVEEILSEARTGQYDLVVIGAHRNRPWQQLLLGNIAREIVARLELPVLVVK
jgi:nucleotide-binding universal stress UspA family protein